MSNYHEIRALETILFSEAAAGFTQDLSLLAHALVAHHEWDINSEQIDWIVQGVMAELQDYYNANYQDPVIDTDEFGSKYWQPEHDAYWDSATVH